MNLDSLLLFVADPDQMSRIEVSGLLEDNLQVPCVEPRYIHKGTEQYSASVSVYNHDVDRALLNGQHESR